MNKKTEDTINDLAFWVQVDDINGSYEAEELLDLAFIIMKYTLGINGV